MLAGWEIPSTYEYLWIDVEDTLDVRAHGSHVLLPAQRLGLVAFEVDYLMFIASIARAGGQLGFQSSGMLPASESAGWFARYALDRLVTLARDILLATADIIYPEDSSRQCATFAAALFFEGFLRTRMNVPPKGRSWGTSLDDAFRFEANRAAWQGGSVRYKKFDYFALNPPFYGNPSQAVEATAQVNRRCFTSSANAHADFSDVENRILSQYLQ